MRPAEHVEQLQRTAEEIDIDKTTSLISYPSVAHVDMAVAGSSALAAVPKPPCLLSRSRTVVFPASILSSTVAPSHIASDVCNSEPRGNISSSSSSWSSASSGAQSNPRQSACCCKSTMYDNPAIYSNDDAVSTQQ